MITLEQLIDILVEIEDEHNLVGKDTPVYICISKNNNAVYDRLQFSEALLGSDDKGNPIINLFPAENME